MQTPIEKAKSLIQEHKYDQALGVLLPMFVQRDNAEICYLIGKCFMEKYDISNVIRFLKRASRMSPEYPNIF